MKVAVIGSRGLTAVNDLEKYLPEETTEIVSGGAHGIDACAKDYAHSHHLKLTEFLPEYALYGRAAPLKRNDLIVAYADMVLAFWDGQSRGTAYVIRKCRKSNKPCKVFNLMTNDSNNIFPQERDMIQDRGQHQTDRKDAEH